MGHVISYVYSGAHLVWGGIKSCFGMGWWMGEKPWLGGDTWKS